jgi:hypothetical protein
MMPAPATPLRRSPLHFRDALLILLIALVSFVISYNSPIRAYSTLDAKGALLTAQALIQDRSLRLEGYKIRDMGWQFIRRNGHLYYAYPLGTPLIAAPFVLISLMTGADMQDEEQEYKTQKGIASCTVAAAAVLIFLIARCYCRPPMSILLTALWSLGSGIISTMGMALWSINFSVIFALVVFLILARYYSGISRNMHPWLLGMSLFAAYLCRPTACLLFLAVVVSLLSESRSNTCKVIAAYTLGFVALVVLSESEFHEPLPFYYNPQYLQSGQVRTAIQWITAVYGLLLSPGRGLFVYQGFLVIVIIAVVLSWRTVIVNKLALTAGGWLLLHFIVVSRWSMWWGGGSYGSRLLVDSFPAWIVLMVVTFSIIEKQSRPIRMCALTVCLLFGVTGVYIHSYQGLYNPYTWVWNEAPGSNERSENRGQSPPNMLDWRYPQFLANPQMCDELNGRAAQRTAPAGADIK